MATTRDPAAAAERLLPQRTVRGADEHDRAAAGATHACHTWRAERRPLAKWDVRLWLRRGRGDIFGRISLQDEAERR
jgi:hypothetical protein